MFYFYFRTRTTRFWFVFNEIDLLSLQCWAYIWKWIVNEFKRINEIIYCEKNQLNGVRQNIEPQGTTQLDSAMANRRTQAMWKSYLKLINTYSYQWMNTYKYEGSKDIFFDTHCFCIASLVAALQLGTSAAASLFCNVERSQPQRTSNNRYH